MDDAAARWHWQQLLSKELALREALSGLGPEATSTEEFKDTLRQWWASIEAALDFYVRALTEGKTLSSHPLAILSSMKGFAGYLAVGKIPAPIANAASEGRRSPGPTEKRDIGLAVAYMLAASKGGIEHWGERIIIADKAPVKTVMDAFGVKRTTAQGWKKTFDPSFLGSNPINGEILKHLMTKAGDRYKASGRSASAIARRGRRN